MSSPRQHPLSTPFRFTLFVTSYLPLFCLIILNQLTRDSEKDWLHWGGWHWPAVRAWYEHFAFASFFGLLIIYGLVTLAGFLWKLTDLARRNGDPVRLLEVHNRNSEAIGYIGTYIIPFLFQQYNSVYEKVATSLLMLMVYRIYVHSTLMLINPVLTLRYSLYEVAMRDASGNTKSGMLISRNRYLETNDSLRLYTIGPRLYFGLFQPAS